MIYAYVLRSIKNQKLYKGYTTDLEARLKHHNAGKVKSTKSGIPWQIIYYESFETEQEARDREKYFKTAAGRRYLKQKI